MVGNWKSKNQTNGETKLKQAKINAHETRERLSL